MEDQKKEHPLRLATIAIYQRIKGRTAPEYLAKIEPVKSHPITFSAPTAMAAQRAAKAWIEEEVGKVEAREAAKEARLEALKKAREAKKTQPNTEEV